MQSPDLKTPEGRKAAIAAAQSLQQALNCDIDPSLQRLVAVRDQMKRFENWKNSFQKPVINHLNCLFIYLSNEIGDKSLSSTELVLPNHSSVHHELTPYTELMHWIKAMDRTRYDRLADVYTSSMSKIYERDIRNFFNLVLANIYYINTKKQPSYFPIFLKFVLWSNINNHSIEMSSRRFLTTNFSVNIDVQHFLKCLPLQ